MTWLFGSPRLNAAVVALFATVALLLSAIGILRHACLQERCSVIDGIPFKVAEAVAMLDIEPLVWVII
jgi:hypothetical protein